MSSSSPHAQAPDPDERAFGRFEPSAADRQRLLSDLNAAQRAAVTHEGAHLLVVAGAGTGKTRALTRRVAWLIARGVAPHAILAITFTNKAADELRHRLERLPGGGGAWAGTFHGFGAFLLRRHGEEIGIDPAFTILDRDDQRSLLRAIIKQRNLDSSFIRPAEVAQFISARKNGSGSFLPYGPSEQFALLYEDYRERLRAARLLDFDDLLLEALRLLRECESVAASYHRRFAHVLVDEYQDTNVVQRDLLLALAGPKTCLTVVGDPDQSIYRWRGAAIRNILEFPEDFPGARTVLLERNYRSTGNILRAAEGVIERNLGRHAKRLETDREEGALVRSYRARDAADEGRVVAGLVRGWLAAGRSLGDVAVFYRVNALSRSIEMGLNENDIPYVIVAGTQFFQRREVKDVLCYARLVENPHDEAAFLRVVNVPRRGVGAASLTKLRAHASARGLSLLDAAKEAASAGIRGRAATGLARFVDLIGRVRAMPRAPVAPILEALVDGSGYRAALADSPDELDRARAENVEELVAYAHEFAAKVPEGGLQSFLERTALVSDQDGYERGRGAVNLMSVHAAKGLEFPCVVIAGAEEGYFPHARNASEPEAVEEERRLFYVAMTRAQDELALTWTAGRTTYTGPQSRRPSMFLGDVPEDVLRHEDLARSPGGTARLGGAFERAGDDVHPGRHAGDGYEEMPIVRETGAGFVVGERVRHPYFGPGALVDVGGRGSETRLTVDFDEHGRKQFLLRLAQLERIP